PDRIRCCRPLEAALVIAVKRSVAAADPDAGLRVRGQSADVRDSHTLRWSEVLNSSLGQASETIPTSHPQIARLIDEQRFDSVDRPGRRAGHAVLEPPQILTAGAHPQTNSIRDDREYEGSSGARSERKRCEHSVAKTRQARARRADPD